MFATRWNALVESLAEALTIKPSLAGPPTRGVSPDGTRDSLWRVDRISTDRHIAALEKGGFSGGKGWGRKGGADVAP